MEEAKVGFGHHLVYLFCWVIAMVLGFLDLVSVRELVLSAVALAEVDLKVVALLDKIGFFGFGVVGLAVIVLVEGYFRSGIHKGQLFERLGLVFGIQLLVLFVFDGGRLLMPGIADAARPSMLQAVMSLVLGVLCIILWRKRRGVRRQG